MSISGFKRLGIYGFFSRFTRYEIAKPKPITAYPIVKGVKVVGIKRVRKPSDKAAKNITLPTNFNPTGLLFNFEFCHIFAAKANKVIPIIRIDQIN